VSDVPPVGTKLGDLQLKEVFLSYDGPKLFSCQSGSGQWFIAVFVDEDDESETYLYAPISYERLVKVRSGRESLRKAFSSPEHGRAYSVRRYLDRPDSEVELIKRDLIPEDWLPDETAKLQIDKPIAAANSPERSAPGLARQPSIGRASTSMSSAVWNRRSLAWVFPAVVLVASIFIALVSRPPEALVAWIGGEIGWARFLFGFAVYLTLIVVLIPFGTLSAKISIPFGSTFEASTEQDAKDLLRLLEETKRDSRVQAELLARESRVHDELLEKIQMILEEVNALEHRIDDLQGVKPSGATPHRTPSGEAGEER
jgi:hypothetical protein